MDTNSQAEDCCTMDKSDTKGLDRSQQEHSGTQSEECSNLLE